MAQFVETIVRLVDDLDGTEGAETIEFGWAGRELVIDLSEVNAKEFHAVMAPYVEVARPRKGKRRKSQASAKTATVQGLSKSEAKRRRDEIREWGRANGFEVSALSKVPQEVIDAYHQAH